MSQDNKSKLLSALKTESKAIDAAFYGQQTASFNRLASELLHRNYRRILETFPVAPTPPHRQGSSCSPPPLTRKTQQADAASTTERSLASSYQEEDEEEHLLPSFIAQSCSSFATTSPTPSSSSAFNVHQHLHPSSSPQQPLQQRHHRDDDESTTTTTASAFALESSSAASATTTRTFPFLVTHTQAASSACSCLESKRTSTTTTTTSVNISLSSQHLCSSSSAVYSPKPSHHQRTTSLPPAASPPSSSPHMVYDEPPLSVREPTFYDLEVARLGTNAVRFVKLTDIPTVVPIQPLAQCSKAQKRFFWYAGQHFPEFADMSLHQCTPNLIFLITGICPLTVSGWRIRGGEYTLYVYFRSERDLRLARALMNGRVQMSRDENGEPGAIIYAQPGMAHADGVKARVFPCRDVVHVRLPEPELSFRLEDRR